MAKTFFVVAGEASGDIHAGRLVAQLKAIYPDAAFAGLGGKNMQAAGVHLFCDMTSLAVVGFVEILKNYRTFKKVFDETLTRIREIRPDAVILVDYPGFNLRLAKEIKKMGLRVIYFISPQVWAWGGKRIHFIRRHIDLMLVLFKFEEILYRDGKFNVKFIGHPLLDIVRATRTREQTLDEIGFKKNFRTIALLPGSRQREVATLLPVMLAAAQRLFLKDNRLQFLICRSGTVPRLLFKETLERMTVDFPYKILDDDTYNGVAASDFAIVASGTATLETAILNTPMVIVYKVSLTTWLLAKLFIKIPNIGLVNVVAGQRISPELIQFDATPQRIARTAEGLLNNKEALEKAHAELYALKNSLGIPGACLRAAQEIQNFLDIRS